MGEMRNLFLDRVTGFARCSDGTKAAAVNEDMIVLVAVLKRLGYPLETLLFIMSALTDSLYRALGCAFQAFLAVVMKAAGMYVLRS